MILLFLLTCAILLIGGWLIRTRLQWHGRKHLHSFQHPGRHVTWAGAIVLLIILVGCSNETATQAIPTQPPLTFSASVSPSPIGPADWPTYHLNNQRTGYRADTPDPRHLIQAWAKQLDGAVYAEPLVVGNHVIVATESDSIYALDPQTGAIQWHTNVGSPVPLSTLPCGNINPLGITGTPVYDPATGLVFAVAEISGPAHLFVGLDVNSGQVKVRRSADFDGMDPRAHQQRSALALANGMIYIAYGGLDGDCSDYIGRVVASRTDGQGSLIEYQVPTPREGGIWTSPGPSVDSAGNLYVSVGNGEVTSGQWDHSDSVLKLSPTLHLLDAFAPTTWGPENASDTDLGSQGPVLLPNQFIFIAGKSGKGYTLRANALGGVGGQVDAQEVCNTYGGAATAGSTIYVPCTDGIRQITVDDTGHIHQGWHTSAVQVDASPVIGGHTLYCIARTKLFALNIDNGQPVTSIAIGSASRFATPTISGTRIFVGTMTGITTIQIA